MKRERYERRLFRLLSQAGCPPARILTISPEELVEVPGITVPNIRTVLCIQSRVLSAENTVRQRELLEAILRGAEEDG